MASKCASVRKRHLMPQYGFFYEEGQRCSTENKRESTESLESEKIHCTAEFVINGGHHI